MHDGERRRRSPSSLPRPPEPSVLALATTSTCRSSCLAAATDGVRPNDALDVFAIVGDHPLDAFALGARERPGVFHRAAQTNVVPQIVRATRILQKIVDVGLPHLEVTILVASVVRLVAIRHWFLSSIARGPRAAQFTSSQATGP